MSEPANQPKNNSNGRRRAHRPRRQPGEVKGGADAAPAQPASKPIEKEEESDDEGAEYCFICTDKIKIAAIYPCNHVTCHECTLKLRGLMSNKHCTQCRTDRSEVIMSRNIDKKFQEFPPESRIYTHDKLGISFDDREVQNEVLGLLRFNCPACAEICGSWKELKRHAQERHHLRFCDLCTRHKKEFTRNFQLYNARDLSKHEREGDNNGFTGHPICSFCSKRFYSGDELFDHLRQEHERCDICTQANPQKPRYFKDSDSLVDHFRKDHYCCMVQTCIDNKFVVFKDEIALRAHMLEVHPGLVGTSKSARTIDLDFEFNNGFSPQLPNGPSNNNSNNNNRKGKKRNDNNTNNDSAQEYPALGRQRQQFSSLSASFGQPNAPAQAAASSASQDSPAALAERRLNERVRNILNYDTGKFSQFEGLNERFLNSELDARDLLTGYKRLFPSVGNIEMGALISDFSKMNVKATGRISSLTRAWEEQNKNQQFPTLGANISQRSTGSGAWASHGGGSTRGRAALSGPSSETAFPSLPPAPKNRVPNVSAPVTRSTTPSYLTLRTNSSSTSSTTKKYPTTISTSTGPSRSSSSTSMNYAAPASQPARSHSAVSVNDDQHFPSLPPARVKPRAAQALPKPRVVEQDDSLTVLRPPRGQDDLYNQANGQANGVGSGGKKGKGKKQLLFHIGM